MKTIKTSRQDIFQTPKRCRICKSRRYLVQLSNRHPVQWYTRYFTKPVFRHLGKIVFKTMLKETVKVSLQDVFQTPKKCRICKSRRNLNLVQEKFGKNVAKTSCETGFNTFLKSGLKIILKLSSQAWCITYMSFRY